MPQKQQKNAQASHYIELGSYQYWPVLVPRGIRLYTYEQIPVFLRENPYITDGYRAYLPSRLCIKRWEDFQNVLQLICELFWFHKLHRSINNMFTATECSTYLSLCPKPQSVYPCLMWLKAVWSKLMISVCCYRWFLGGEWHVFMWMIVFVLFWFGHAAFSFCPMRLWISGVIFWASFFSSVSGCTTWPQFSQLSVPPGKTMSSTPSDSSASRYSQFTSAVTVRSNVWLGLTFWHSGFSSFIVCWN